MVLLYIGVYFPLYLRYFFFFFLEFLDIEKYQIGEKFSQEDKIVSHPYAVGVLVTTSTFLIVFKLNQSYNRYWEACGNTHQFMSKWMDAATHTSIYHMQCEHYAGIRPPSFFDHPELNYLNMTRDRERMNPQSNHQPKNSNGDDENDGHDNEAGTGLRNRKQTQQPTSQSQVPNVPQSQKISSRNSESPVENDIFSGDDRATTSSSTMSEEAVKKINIKEMKAENRRRSFVKSINNPDNSTNNQRVMRRAMWQSNYPRGRSVSSLYSVIPKSIIDIDMIDLESDHLYEDSVFDSFGSGPIPLVGKPRLDGNWGNYYTVNPEDPLCTFYDPNCPNKIDPKGFASSQGHRTPPLFLQELAHLSSLLCAVALSTLRNDIEGCESPLAIYEPGQPWPEVDSSKEELIQMEGFKAIVAVVKNFLGFALTAEQRSQHNAAQPLPVIGGVSDAEIRFLQIARGPYAKTQLCFNWLSEFIIREQLAGSLGGVAPPIVSRIFQFLGDGMIHYNHARKIMFIPFPFGHAQLSVLFVLSMMLAIPFLMNQYTTHPITGGLLTFFTVLCLFGINEVARDLENPFRNFPNELPLVNFQAQFNEGLITMFAGYHPDFFWDADTVMRKIAARSSGRGAGRKKQQNGGHSLKNTTPSDSYLKNITINVKPQKDGYIAPLENSKDDAPEVAVLKAQVQDQLELIEELYASVSSMDEGR